MKPHREQEAAFYEPESSGRLTCGLCPHQCVIAPGRWGRCKTRRNVDGILTVPSYSRLLAGASDPVEKKPLFHFRPGSHTFSIASAGCNLRCPFCQNHHLSQPDDVWNFSAAPPVSPETIARSAAESGATSISFTYSEPILMFELARDTAIFAAEAGLDLVFVTNGQASEQAAAEIGGFIRAANVDLKCFSEDKYRRILDGELNSTLRTLELWHQKGVWVEVTTLLVPGFNDSDGEIQEIARFIAGIDPNIPWHVSRFHPDYQWHHLPATPKEKILRAREIGLAEGLRFVYTGNLHGAAGEDTRCPSCSAPVIERRGFSVRRTALTDGRCDNCGENIAGVGLP